MNYIDSVPYQVTVSESFNLQSHSKKSSRLTTTTTSSQRKHDLLMTKNAVRLKSKSKLPYAPPNKNTKLPFEKGLEIQTELMAIQELEEDYFQSPAAAKLNDTKLTDN